MKKYLKEIIIAILQLFMFYIFPLFAGPTDAMGMVFIIILTTFCLSLILGILSQLEFKCLYPIGCAIVFFPSVFIYYNESAIIHASWYLVISAIGILIGSLIKNIVTKFKR